MSYIRCLTLIFISMTMLLFADCLPNDNYKGSDIYIVTYETNGGEVVNSQAIDKNGEISAPSEPTKEGYKFDGWFLNAELTDEARFPMTVTKDVTLYAKWLKYYKVTFETNGGDSIETLTVTEKDAVDNIKQPRKEYCVFDGWCGCGQTCN